MDKEKAILLGKLKKNLPIKCKMGRNEYTLDGYNMFDAIELLGKNGASPKTKEVMDDLLFEQLREKVSDTGIEGRVLVSSADGVEFQCEEIYNRLFAFDIIEFYYNEHDDIEKIKLTDIGKEIYKERKRNFF